MTDRELLVMAARAAGLDAVMTQPFIGLKIRGGNLWNPLTDDGDALRLAVRLGILLRTDFIKQLAELMHQGMDHGKATRRAITLAAAETGRAMP